LVIGHKKRPPVDLWKNSLRKKKTLWINRKISIIYRKAMINSASKTDIDSNIYNNSRFKQQLEVFRKTLSLDMSRLL